MPRKWCAGDDDGALPLTGVPSLWWRQLESTITMRRGTGARDSERRKCPLEARFHLDPSNGVPDGGDAPCARGGAKRLQ